jgi:hypothetical protein
LAARLIDILRERDPLSEPVHLRKSAMLVTAGSGAARALLRRLVRAGAPTQGYQLP